MSLFKFARIEDLEIKEAFKWFVNKPLLADYDGFGGIANWFCLIS